MAYPKSLRQPFRQGQLTVGAGWRAYFAPFNQSLAVTTNNTSTGVSVYDLIATGAFNENTPPAGWSDLGWTKNFKITPGSKIGSIASGYRGAIRAKYRGEVGETFSLDFAEMSHMAYKIATGAQVFNLLKSTASPSSIGPLSSSGTAAVALGASGYVAAGTLTGANSGLPTLYVPAGSGAQFAAGTMIVCDLDYNGTSFGFVGDSGAIVSPFSLPADPDFIRKTSDYVATVAAVVAAGSGGVPAGQDALVLNQVFVGGGNNVTGVGGTPTTTLAAGSLAKVQGITGYTAREGGTAITEWSAIFSMATVDDSQFVFYYPRVAPAGYGGFSAVNIPGINADMNYELPATFEAMAYDDPLDGETVVCYRAYFPRAGQQIAI